MIKQLIKTQKRLFNISTKIQDKLEYNMATLEVSQFYLRNIKEPKFNYFILTTKKTVLKFNTQVNNYIAKLKDFKKIPLEKGGKYFWDTQELYVMKNEYGLYKIGISKDPERRRRQLKNAGGVGIDLLISLRVLSAREEEKKLHQRFKTSRKQGEFFKFEGSDTEVLAVVMSYVEDYSAHIVGI